MKKKAIFKNELFYWALLLFLFVLILVNAYNLFQGVVLSLLPLIVQLVLIVLIFDKSEHVKKGIFIWSILLMLGPFLLLISQLLFALSGAGLDPKVILLNLFLLIIGVSVYYFNKDTVEIITIEETNNNTDV